ncbi:fluoride efflux transporter FluC [Billgrantia gudaonensis]|uniref:Fluoride-specific ion channel FluC n=1 Tax=Billgrantia gudaonensis TaxID=376427 RepID=A0A1G8YHU3_9GAMM|nr:CrcB family protein [Halomonas gudaonensis]SDK02459.1 CrcB protein [Halomonas gudaonensis]
MQVDGVEMLAVTLGGAVGGMARLAVVDVVGRRLSTRFPWGTLAVNLSGAWLMGMLAGGGGLVAGPAWSLLAIGLLGGYTTVSSFSLQTLTLWQQGRESLAVGYVAVTLLAGLGALAMGAWLAGGLA